MIMHRILTYLRLIHIASLSESIMLHATAYLIDFDSCRLILIASSLFLTYTTHKNTTHTTLLQKAVILSSRTRILFSRTW
uniref:Putative secreted protein n=1 Tax=Anopheles triannulatus TaxID=58253 RepID=A0A2M4B6B2_9DIPT